MPPGGRKWLGSLDCQHLGGLRIILDCLENHLVTRTAQTECLDFGPARALDSVPEPELRPARAPRVVALTRNDLLVKTECGPDNRGQS